MVTIVVSTISEICQRGPAGGGGKRLTWLLGIVGIKFGSEARCYSHFDKEYDRVQ